jgi:hypothetical protein
MHLHQVSISYVPEQDRLLLRVRGHSGEQLSAWLTRRLIMRLWPALQQVGADAAGAELAGRAVATREAAQMMAEATRREVKQTGDFAQPFEPATAFPIGEQPLLVQRVDLTRHGSGLLGLNFVESAQRAFNVNVDRRTWEALQHLIEQGVAKAQWGAVAAAPPAAADDARPPLLS